MKWVKILLNKEGTQGQVAGGSQAQLAMSHLNRHKLHGKSVCIITLSKDQSVQLPYDGQKDKDPTRELWQLIAVLLQRTGPQGLPEHPNTLSYPAVSNIPPLVSEKASEASSPMPVTWPKASCRRTVRWY